MNDRIKELVLASGFSIDFIEDVELSRAQQKFAELIIAECIHIDIQHWDESPGDAIREHFGVE